MAITFTATTVSNPSGAQGSYPLDLTAGHEGMLADLQAYVCRSYRNQSGAAIPYGVLVQTDNSPASNDPYAVELVSGVSNIQGMAISSQVLEGASLGSSYTPNPTPVGPNSRYGYPNTETVNVVSKGVIWVYSAEAIALGDAVRFYISDHSGTLANAFQGRFGKSSVAGVTVAVTGARWVSETTAAGLALLEIDIPGMTYSAD